MPEQVAADVDQTDVIGAQFCRGVLNRRWVGSRLHTLVAEHLPDSWSDLDPAQASGRVGIGIETDRGTWVQAG